tara:strand:+ start:2609 stop:2941 length:333 start_codon:yes stop_codon:yes gene_type:complete
MNDGAGHDRNLTHHREDARKLQTDPGHIGFLIKYLAQQNGGIAVADLARDHQREAEAGFGTQFEIRVGGESAVGGFGCLRITMIFGIIGKSEECGNRHTYRRYLCFQRTC